MLYLSYCTSDNIVHMVNLDCTSGSWSNIFGIIRFVAGLESLEWGNAYFEDLLIQPTTKFLRTHLWRTSKS